MPTFTYTARTVAGELQDRDDRSAVARRRRRAAPPPALSVVKVDEEPRRRSRRRGHIKMRDIVIFTRQFSTMINAGLPLVQALTFSPKQSENKVLSDVTRNVVFDVESGHTVADALAQAPEGVQRPVREHGRRR